MLLPPEESSGGSSDADPATLPIAAARCVPGTSTYREDWERSAEALAFTQPVGWDNTAPPSLLHALPGAGSAITVVAYQFAGWVAATHELQYQSLSQHGGEWRTK